MLGIPILDSTTKDFIFNKNPIFEEKFGVYSKKYVTLDLLKNFNIVRLGLVEDDYNANWILSFFDTNNINIDITYAKTYKELEQLIEEDKIDLMVDSGYKKSNYNLIYEFSGRQVYIAGNKNNRDILEKIDKAILDFKSNNILSKSNLGPNKICLEIIERVKINDLNKITRNINSLKDAGFKIAIDDFGVEYSNLDVLHKLDVDIIKVDKNFVDGIGKDMIKSETILFISRIARAKNKSIVLEGVEEEEQHIEIKKIKNEHLYVQGYYYNKPMNIESIANL